MLIWNVLIAVYCHLIDTRDSEIRMKWMVVNVKRGAMVRRSLGCLISD